MTLLLEWWMMMMIFQNGILSGSSFCVSKLAAFYKSILSVRDIFWHLARAIGTSFGA
jgi:hypothetical protein